jgi:hypothetical protein
MTFEQGLDRTVRLTSIVLPVAPGADIQAEARPRVPGLRESSGRAYSLGGAFAISGPVSGSPADLTGDVVDRRRPHLGWVRRLRSFDVFGRKHGLPILLCGLGPPPAAIPARAQGSSTLFALTRKFQYAIISPVLSRRETLGVALVDADFARPSRGAAGSGSARRLGALWRTPASSLPGSPRDTLPIRVTGGWNWMSRRGCRI